MAGIRGQPAPKPSSLGSPVPGDDAAAAARAFVDSAGKNPAAIPAPSDSSQDPAAAAASFMQQQNPSGTQPKRWNDVSASGLGQGAIDAIPAVGGMIGAGLGAAAGFLSPVPGGAAMGGLGGAALGGMAGASLKSAIESALGNAPKSRSEFYGGVAKEGLDQAANYATGELIPAAVQGGKAAIAKAGEAMGIPKQATGTFLDAPDVVKQLAAETHGDVATAADAKRTDFQRAIEETRGQLEDPALQLMNSKATLKSDREVGDSVKTLIKQNVDQRYGPLKEAYAQLDEINQSVPLPDDARREFGQGLKNWALEQFPQKSKYYDAVKQYADSFDASSNGLQFSNVVKELNGEITTAFRMGDTERAQVLKQVKAQANDFMDNRITNLAKSITKGKATPEELGFLTQMLDKTGANSYENAKTMANNYLNAKDAIKSDYSGFKKFMEGLGEQTKVRSSGTFDFLNNLEEIPSEKLVSKMFDTDNTRALQMMKKETPEVFDALAKNKVKEMMSDAMVDGKLNVTDFYKNVQNLPKEVQSLLFTPQDMVTIGKTVLNPKYVKLTRTLSEIDPNLITPGKNPNSLLAVGANPERSGKMMMSRNHLQTLSDITGKNMVHDAQIVAAMEHYGKTKLTREQIYKTIIGAGQGIANMNPMQGITKTAAGKQLAGQVVQPGVNSVLRGATSVGEQLLPRTVGNQGE